MPRAVDPSTLTSGGGVASPGSVGDEALQSPSRDRDPLRSHITDPAGAHLASAIELTDAGGLFSSDNVEGALEEISGGVGAGTGNGVIEGGTYTAVGLTITFATPTTLLVAGSAVDLSGVEFTLTNAVSHFVYYDVSAGALAKNASAPTLASGDVLLAYITTAGSAVTASVDGRRFVYNDSRKNPLILREAGASADQRSEANFLTLEAALLWLSVFGAGGEQEAYELIVRGQVDISSTAPIAVSNLTIVGDGGGGFTTGATVAPMFDVTGTRVRFRDVVFVCDHVNSDCIGGDGLDMVVSGCRFETGAQTWRNGILLDSSSNMLVDNTYIQASSNGISIDEADTTTIRSCYIEGSLGSGSAGVYLWHTTVPGNDQGRCSILDCTIYGFGESVNIRGSGYVVSGGLFEGATNGFYLRAGIATTPDASRVSNVSVVLDATTGVSGVLIEGQEDVICTGVTVRNPRTVWGTPDEPFGFYVDNSSQVRLVGCSAVGFYNSADVQGQGFRFGLTSSVTVEGCYTESSLYGINVEGGGYSDYTIRGNEVRALNTGIYVQPGVERVVISSNMVDGLGVLSNGIVVTGTNTATTRTRDVSIADNTVYSIASAGIYVGDQVFNVSVTGNNIDGYLSGATLDPTAVGGIRVFSSATAPQGVTITGNTVQRCQSGILVQGATSSVTVGGFAVCNNTIRYCGFAQGSLTDTFANGSKGIGIDWAVNGKVSGNVISAIGQQITDAGVPGAPTSGGAIIESYGVLVRNSMLVSVNDNNVSGLQKATTGEGHGILIAARSTGAVSPFVGISCNDNVLLNTPDVGVYIQANDGGVGSTTIILAEVTVNSNTMYGLGAAGVLAEVGQNSTLQGLTVADNEISAVTATTDAYIRVAEIGGTSTAHVEDISIVNNSTIEGTGGTATTHIVVDGGSAGTFFKVVVEGNHLQAANVASKGIQVKATAASGTEIAGGSVSGNILSGFTGNGIELDADYAFGVAVDNNKFVKQGGVAIASTIDGFRSLSFRNNLISGFNASSLMTGGISVTAADTSAVQTELKVSDNSVTDYTSYGVRLVVNAPLSGVSFQNNSFSHAGLIENNMSGNTSSGYTSTAALYIDMGNAALGTPALANCAVTGNTFDSLMSRAFFLDNSSGTSPLDGSIVGLDVTRNKFVGCVPGTIRVANNGLVSGSTITVNGTSYLGGTAYAVGGSATATATNIAAALVATFGSEYVRIWSAGDTVYLVGQSWYMTSSTAGITVNGSDSTPFLIINDGAAETWNVSDNMFARCGATGNDWSILSVQCYGDGASYKNINIDRNTVDGAPAGAIAFRAQEGVSTYAGTVVGLSLSDNDVSSDVTGSGGNIGVYANLEGVGTVRQVNLDRNKVYGPGFSVGLEVDAATVATAFQALTLNGNQVDSVRSQGILVQYPSTSGINVYGVEASGNHVTSAGDDGIRIGGFNPPVDGGGNGTAFDIFNFLLSGNVVRDCDGHGLRLLHEVGLASAVGDSNARNLTIANNILQGNGQGGTAADTTYDGGKHNLSLRLTGETASLMVAHNQTVSGKAYGIFVDVGDGDAETAASIGLYDSNEGTIDAASFVGNISRLNGSVSAATMTDCGKSGTNYAATAGLLMGNINQSTSAGGNNTWADIAGAMTTANNVVT